MVGLDPMQRSEKVIKVAAADNIGSKAEFSNFFLRIPPSGCCVSAPGVRIYSTMPDGNYDFLDGTSMAAPIVSGIIALLKSSKPELTNQQIMKIISETGRPTANPFQGPFIQASTALARARF
jgi:subtilisin family serine protease